MSRIDLTIPLIILCSVWVSFQSCKKDPIADLRPSITSSQSELSAGRGQIAIISFHVSSPVALREIVISTKSQGDQNISFEAGSKELNLEYPFTVPAESQLHDKHEVTVLVTDENQGETQWQTEVVTTALISVPSDYQFERTGQTSIDFSGQTQRLEMVSAIKSYLNEGNRGQPISAQILLDAYRNTGENGNGFFDFSSTKQLKDKTFSPDLDESYFENLFQEAEIASQNGVQQIIASEGTAGLLVRENNQSTILVNKYGQEYTQLIEKGFMGSVMLHQIYNTYLTDDQIGINVENVQTSEGTNYTSREHHWDEAYGYFHAPSDFASNWPSDRRGELRFWSNYSNIADGALGLNNTIMSAFIAGRTAIVNNDQAGVEEARSNLYDQLELIPAAIAIHYINATLASFNDGNIGEAFHTLTEAWAFTRCLIYHPFRRIELAVIDSILYQDLGTDSNFWTVTPAGLQNAKSKLVSNFPSLESVKDIL